MSGSGQGEGGDGSGDDGFRAHHGALSAEEREQLAALQRGEQPVAPQQTQPQWQQQQQQQRHAEWQAQQQQQQAQQQQQHAEWQAQQQQQQAQQQRQWQQQQQRQAQSGQQQEQWQQGQQQAAAEAHPSPAGAVLPKASIGEVRVAEGNPIAIALGRAYRVAIRPEEVTAGERAKLLAASPPVADPILQGFLAWRKSVLLAVALLLIPITVLKVIDFSAQTEGLPDTLTTLLTFKLIGDIGFAIAIWLVLPKWTQWRSQRRLLIVLWFIYFMIPFLIFLYPWVSALEGVGKLEMLTGGMVFSLYAVMSLAPKAVSLMPGLMRGAIAIKLLLPGSSAPGWLIALGAPIYAIFFYIILVMPYQISGSGFFVGAMVGFTGAQIWMAKMGYQLARPELHGEAEAAIKQVRAGFHLFNAFGVLMLIIALFEFAEKLDMSVLSIIDLVAAFVANVLLLTVIATDLLVTNLHRAATIGSDPSTHQAQLAYQEAIKHFAPPSEN